MTRVELEDLATGAAGAGGVGPGGGGGGGGGAGTGAGAAFAGLPGGGCLLPTLFCAGRDGAVRELCVAGEVLATMRSPAGQPVLCLEDIPTCSLASLTTPE